MMPRRKARKTGRMIAYSIALVPHLPPSRRSVALLCLMFL
jgi:hypothetical protein